MGTKNRTKGTGSLQKEKNGTYTIRAMINGKHFSKSTRTKNREEAEKILEQFLRPFVKDDKVATYENLKAFAASAEQQAEIEEDKRPQMKLTEVWDAYLKSPERRDLSQTTLDAKKQVWRLWTEWMQTKHPEIEELRRVTVEMAEEYLAYLRVDHSASTYNSRLCVIREMTRVVAEKARVKKNPWENMKQRDDDSCRRRELTIEEIQRLARQARKQGDEWERLFCIGVYTGLRLGDCCNLEWKCVDLVRSIIQVIPHKTRKYAHGKPVTIPIHPTLAENLMRTKVSERLGCVLPTIAGYYRRDRPKVSYTIGRIFRNAGIVTSVHVEGRKWKVPEATFHSLRHTFVSLAANAGIPLHIVQSIVGHESTAMTRHYYHENEAALRKAVAAIPAIGGSVAQRQGEGFFRAGAAQTAAPGVEYFPDAESAVPTVPAAPSVPALPVATEPVIEVPAPVIETVGKGEEIPATPMTPEVVEPAKPVTIPQGAKVEIREFGRVYVDGVATGGRIGGAQRKVLPPKAAWMGEVMNRWAHRHSIGILEATMQLVGNGGHKFLQQLYDRATIDDPGEALDIMSAYLKGRGIDID